MTLRPRFLAACSLIAVLAAPASAEDAAPASALAFLGGSTADWTGPYVGLETGIEIGGPAVVAGLHGGYRHQIGPVVLGGEAGLGGSFGSDGEEAGGRARAGVKVGYDAMRAVPYLTGGYSKGKSDGAYYGVGVDVPLERPASLGAEILQYELEGGASATTLTVRVTQRF